MILFARPQGYARSRVQGIIGVPACVPDLAKDDNQGSGSCKSLTSYRCSSPEIAAFASDFFQDVRVLSDGERRSSLGLNQYLGRFQKEKLAQRERVRGGGGGF